MNRAEPIARVIRQVFRHQRQLAERGKKRFGDLTTAFANALFEPISKEFLRVAKDEGADKELAPDLVAAARERSLFAARSMNTTSGERLSNEEPAKQVFSMDRAVEAALTEQSYAEHTARAMIAQDRGDWLEWVADAKACDACKKLNGKRVKAGKPFGVIQGEKVYNAPAHVSCRCSVKTVKGRKKTLAEFKIPIAVPAVSY